MADSHMHRCLSWFGGDCNCPGWDDSIPENVAAYAAGMFHASRAFPPFELASWRQISRCLQAVGFDHFPPYQLQAAALAWLAASVDAVALAWLHQPPPRRRPAKRPKKRPKKGPPIPVV